MKRTALLFVLLSYASLTSPAEHPVEQPRRYLNLMIFNDGDGYENIDTPRSTALTTDLGLAIHQQAGAIITSPNILRNILLSQQEFPDPVADVGPIRAENKTSKYVFSRIRFVDDEWDIYRYLSRFTGFSSYLLIPHRYKEYIERGIKRGAIEAWLANPDNLDAWQKEHPGTTIPTADDIRLGLNLSSPRMQKISIAALKANPRSIGHSFAFQVKDMLTHGNGWPFGTWNIFLNGHGLYEQNMVQGVVIDPRDPVRNYQERDGAIAGLKIADYRKFLAFLTKRVDTGLLYYSTCFGGGMNTILPYVGLLQNAAGNLTTPLEPNFIIVSGALTDTVTYAVIHLLAREIFGETQQQALLGRGIDPRAHARDFPAFFVSLADFFSQIIVRGTPLSKSPFRDILGHITEITAFAPDDPKGITSTPLIRFPGAPFFRAVDVHRRTATLSQALVRRHELEGLPIEVRDKDAILLYTRAVRVPINITSPKRMVVAYSTATVKKPPAIVSMIPGRVDHFLTELSVDTSDSMFFSNAFGSLPLKGTKRFLIKKFLASSNLHNNTLVTKVGENIVALTHVIMGYRFGGGEQQMQKYVVQRVGQYIGERSANITEENLRSYERITREVIANVEQATGFDLGETPPGETPEVSPLERMMQRREELVTLETFRQLKNEKNDVYYNHPPHPNQRDSQLFQLFPDAEGSEQAQKYLTAYNYKRQLNNQYNEDGPAKKLQDLQAQIYRYQQLLEKFYLELTEYLGPQNPESLRQLKNEKNDVYYNHPPHPNQRDSQLFQLFPGVEDVESAKNYIKAYNYKRRLNDQYNARGPAGELQDLQAQIYRYQQLLEQFYIELIAYLRTLPAGE